MRKAEPCTERLLIAMSLEDRERLEGLAGEDGVSLAQEVRALVKRETARRRSRKMAPAGSVVECFGCPRAKRWGE